MTAERAKMIRVRVRRRGSMGLPGKGNSSDNQPDRGDKPRSGVLSGTSGHRELVDVTEVGAGGGELDRIRRVVVERDIHRDRRPRVPRSRGGKGDTRRDAVDDDAARARTGREGITNAERF